MSNIIQEYKKSVKAYNLKIKQLKAELKAKQVKLIMQYKKEFWNPIIKQIMDHPECELIGYIITEENKFTIAADLAKFVYKDITFVLRADNKGLYSNNAYLDNGEPAPRFWVLGAEGPTITALIDNIETFKNNYVK